MPIDTSAVAREDQQAFPRSARDVSVEHVHCASPHQVIWNVSVYPDNQAAIQAGPVDVPLGLRVVVNDDVVCAFDERIKLF